MYRRETPRFDPIGCSLFPSCLDPRAPTIDRTRTKDHRRHATVVRHTPRSRTRDRIRSPRVKLRFFLIKVARARDFLPRPVGRPHDDKARPVNAKLSGGRCEKLRGAGLCAKAFPRATSETRGDAISAKSDPRRPSTREFYLRERLSKTSEVFR